MAQSAIGLIETQGLVGVIEAADTAAKAADVRLLGIERIGGGLVSLRFSGDVASVQAAVQAASEAVQQVSELISAHVIPQPHPEVEKLSARTLLPPLGAGRPDGDDPVPSGASAPTTAAPLPDLHALSKADLESLSVTRLRQLARRTPGVGMLGRQISRANKGELVQELLRATEVGSGA